MVELVDTRDLKSLGCNGHAGSNPARSTKIMTESIFNKGLRIVLSCKTKEQKVIATKWLELAINNKLINYHDFIMLEDILENKK